MILLGFKKGDRLVCCSRLCENFVFGKEYVVKEVSYSGGTLIIIDEDGEWAGIGYNYFTTYEKFKKMTENYINQKDQEIKKSWEEFDNFREEQNNEMLKEMNGK